MSYILDALRKADAQRERDPARGIHAQPVTAAAPASAPGWKRPPLIALAVAVFALVAALATWRSPAPAPAAAAVVPAPVAHSPSGVARSPGTIAPAPATALLPPA